ncbi:envelope stress response protein PspG [Enterobacillus tribolii]|uniref:Phage shock protein G n=1 Tax=Enterobacillus tribolii TaxID=1487935 RepID=A0A370QGN7_9GAMM|nr:envelope stress response protein PspG [Enterobacillus tribolii]MBW7981846.1 envelope stress response protein PspG [Enterobacillus tribolii]RDK87527.1 phage shock protein G [Enterobacillus tribolii]
MLEFIFVVGFVVVLMMTGVSILGVIAAVFAAAMLMVFGGLFALVIKLLPWLLLAIIGVWIYRAVQKPQPRRYRRYY